MSKRFLTYRELEAEFGIKAATAAGYVCKGLMPCIKVGRRNVLFERAEIEAWFNERRRAVGPSGGRSERPRPRRDLPVGGEPAKRWYEKIDAVWAQIQVDHHPPHGWSCDVHFTPSAGCEDCEVPDAG